MSISASVQWPWIAFGGVFSHLIFKKHEPTVDFFFHYLLSLATISFSFNLYTSLPPTEPILPNTFLLVWQSALTTLAILTVYLLTLSTSISIYRLFFHPLKDIPGPLLGKITAIWSAFSVKRGKHYLDVEALHQKHGAFVRLGPEEVSILHPDAVFEIFGGHTNLGKSKQYPGGVLRGGLEPSLLLIRDPVKHSMKRKDWAKGFTTDAMKEYQTVFEQRTLELLQGLNAERIRGPVDLTLWFKAFATTVMGDLSGFPNFNRLQDRNDTDGFWAVLEDYVAKNAALRKLPPWHGFLARGSSTGLKMFQFVAGKLRERFSRQAESKDMFHFIMGKQNSVDLNSIIPAVTRDALLLMIAGSDTTQGALASLFHCLLQHPKLYATLQSSVDELYQQSGVPSTTPLPTKILASSRTLEAYINEALRINPPVKSGQPREVPAGGKIVCGTFLPGGTTISASAWSMHRSPQLFSRPTEFRPERWLEPEKEELFTPQAFFPFSHGPMNCIGKAVAMDELRMVTATLVRTFDMEPVRGGGFEDFESNMRDWTVTIMGPLKVKLRERKLD
ncbi:cytochrome P450 [Atractiella rhizophila]|nr:cytochrome P450 [Atractiella rhizophila]